MQTCSINGIRLPFLSSDSLQNIYTLSARFLLNSNNVNEVFFSVQFFIRIMFRNPNEFFYINFQTLCYLY